MDERKRFRDTEVWKLIRTAIEILLIVAIIYGIVTAFRTLGISEAFAEDSYPGNENEVAFVICMPGDYVNVRPFPSTKNERIGYLDPGEMVYLDGKKKNGFVHCVGMHTESGEGWVYKGYLVDEEPERMNQKASVNSKGRLAARRSINGKRRKWLQPQDIVRVYYWTDEWALTDSGYVKSKYLDLIGE